MRVAPMALLDAGYKLRNQHSGYSLTELATAGCQVAECTHKHPLGFLPAALLTTLLHKVLFLTPDQVKEDIDHIVESCIRILGRIYKEEKYAPYKKALPPNKTSYPCHDKPQTRRIYHNVLLSFSQGKSSARA